MEPNTGMSIHGHKTFQWSQLVTRTDVAYPSLWVANGSQGTPLGRALGMDADFVLGGWRRGGGGQVAAACRWWWCPVACHGSVASWVDGHRLDAAGAHALAGAHVLDLTPSCQQPGLSPPCPPASRPPPDRPMPVQCP